MTRFEKDYINVVEGNEIEVLTNRKEELTQLRRQLKSCKNRFKAQCLIQEIERLEKEYCQIGKLF